MTADHIVPEEAVREVDGHLEVPDLHELEAVVMEELWRLGSATVRQVLDALNQAEPKERAYTTIMTIMRRLHSKGLLKRERHDRTDVYSPVMSREEYMQAQARQRVEALVGQFGDVALANFARQIEGLGPERLDALRRLAGQAGDSDRD